MKITKEDCQKISAAIQLAEYFVQDYDVSNSVRKEQNERDMADVTAANEVLDRMYRSFAVQIQMDAFKALRSYIEEITENEEPLRLLDYLKP